MYNLTDITKAKGEPVPTLPFVTSSMSATPEREDWSPADSVPRHNLRTIGAPQRFVISSDSSHHSGANIAEAEVDSIIRSSAPAIATVTTVTAAINTEATATRAPVTPSLLGVGSSSTSRSDSIPGGFSDLFTEFNVVAARQISLNAEVRMRAEYNIREKRKLRAVVDGQAELMKTKNREIKSLKAQLLLKEAEAAEAIYLRVEVFKFESPEQSLRGEVGFLRDQNTALEREKNELNVKVTDLSPSVKVREQEVADLDASCWSEKVAAYEGFISQLEKFQDEKLEEVNEKFERLYVDFFEMALHLEEKFYLHLLTTISGHRWLLTYGMELAVAKCLNFTEYLSALGAAISKAVEKGMQEGLSARITHGAEEPKSNKDASVDTIMNLLRLDTVLAKRLGLTESQPHVDQLMVPIYHSLDQRVVGMEGTSGSTPDVAATLSTTLVSASTIPPISTNDYEVAHAKSQGGARVDDETAADDDMNLFVSNADLNISE
nr:hypothetical protein [Tanacetum cinerariifolium]